MQLQLRSVPLPLPLLLVRSLTPQYLTLTLGSSVRQLNL
jgi:hypothetical protein